MGGREVYQQFRIDRQGGGSKPGDSTKRENEMSLGHGAFPPAR